MPASEIAKKAAPKKAPAKRASKKATTLEEASKQDPIVADLIRPPRRKGPAKPPPVVVEDEVEVEIDLRNGQPVAVRNYSIGDRSFSMHFYAGCVICTHPQRALIEEQLLRGMRSTTVANWASGKVYEKSDGTRVEWPEIDAKQVGRHWNEGHLGANDHFLVSASEQQQVIGEYSGLFGRAVNGFAFSEYVVGDAQDKLIRGELKVSMKDANVANKALIAREMMLMKMAGENGGEEDQAWIYNQTMDIIFAHLQRILTPEQQEQFTQILRSDKQLLELRAATAEASSQARVSA